MSIAIGNLQEDGAIEHSRGKLTLLDCNGACACYEIVRKEYKWLLK